MGAKKQEEKSKKVWTKVLAVVVGVLFVILMIVSSMGSSWISSLATVKPGDVVVVDYTLKDAGGNVLLTSNYDTYLQLANQGSNVLYSKQLTLTANQSLAGSIYPVQVYSANSGWSTRFALFASEYEAISKGVIGMNGKGKKTIALTSSMPLTQFWSVDQLESKNMNLSAIEVGQLIALGVSDNPEAADENSTSSYYVRIGEITNKTPEGVTLDFAYPQVDVTVVSINEATS